MGPEFEQDGKHVFVYGSLMYLPVWVQVVKGVYPCLNAIAKGYKRHAVPGETYPAMVAHDVLTEELWSVSRFEAEGMQAFLNKHVGSWNRTGQRK